MNTEDLEQFPPLDRTSDIGMCRTYILDFWRDLDQVSIERRSPTFFVGLADRLSTILALIKQNNALHRKERIPLSTCDPWMDLLHIMFCMIAHTRDIALGRGERMLTYMMISVWYTYFPVLAVSALDQLVHPHQSCVRYGGPYGSWRDILGLCDYLREHSRLGQDHPLIDSGIEMIHRQLFSDWTAYQGLHEGNGSASISNAAKWIPRENSKSTWLFERMVLQWSWTHSPNILRSATSASSWTRAVSKCKRMYRQVFSTLSVHALDIIEHKQCFGKWSDIDMDHVTISSRRLYWDALLNQMRDLDVRKDDCDDRTQCATKMRAKTEERGKRELPVHSTGAKQSSLSCHTVGPSVMSYDFTHLIERVVRYICLLREQVGGLGASFELAAIQSEWTNILAKLTPLTPLHKDHEDYCIPILFGYTHISDPRLYHAIGQACFIAENGHGNQVGKRILFIGHQPTWINLDGCSTLVSCVETILQCIQPNMGVNIIAAFSLLQYGIRTCLLQCHQNVSNPMKVLFLGYPREMDSNHFSLSSALDVFKGLLEIHSLQKHKTASFCMDDLRSLLFTDRYVPIMECFRRTVTD